MLAGVVTLDEEAGAAVLDHVAQPADRGGDDRASRTPRASSATSPNDSEREGTSTTSAAA